MVEAKATIPVEHLIRNADVVLRSNRGLFGPDGKLDVVRAAVFSPTPPTVRPSNDRFIIVQAVDSGGNAAFLVGPYKNHRMGTLLFDEIRRFERPPQLLENSQMVKS